ncbi:Glucose--fructose oxidoreductase precursor [Rubripirellula amarantea]|uniref:Glucose--fructose oxidoreductase n=1 Tax=Rubripirellula amarantea TaxID=2527999 RepID=A0A5C5WXN1_9BACT|nr:Gfo/Idh/MocA family oxidoreductase [Rubripirellula amarantea]TWT54645.1 Glucose--fructose oxidoreductase precursor [Rubripirellula amarantea]
MSHSNPDRREFTKTLSAAIAAGMASGGFFSTAPSAKANATTNGKVGVALVGLGNLSTNQLAPALQKTKVMELRGIVTGTPAKADKWQQQYGIAKEHTYNYDNYDEIANDDAIDVIYVVLPNGMHPEYTIRAAKAGKHVLCEKPMANSSEECRQMIAACKDANRKLAIGYRCQFDPFHRRCIELAREQTFGKLKFIEAGFGFKIGDPNQWRLKSALAGGGALMDVGIYALQACRYLTGEEPLEITAQETKTDPVKFAEVDETITWSMKFPSGVSTSCMTTYGFNGINQFTGLCDNGWFGLDPAFSYAPPQPKSSNPSQAKLDLDPVDQFAAEMDAFARCVLHDEPSSVPGEEGLRDLVAIEAIYESIRTGKAVSLA